MSDRTLAQQTEQVFRGSKIISRRGFMLAFMILAVSLSGGCGQVQSQVQEENAAQEGTEELSTDEYVDSIPDFEQIENDAIKESIRRYYGREEDEEISEEEIEAVRGKLPAYSLTIHSGEEFALMREWYAWDDVHTVTVDFSEDVTGTLPEGISFPKQIKEVTLLAYQEGSYAALLRLLQDSQVEAITVRADAKAKRTMGFWLDDVAQIGTLQELKLDGISIRTRETSLDGCKLTRIEGDIDKDTDLGFVEELVRLEEFSGRILDERDLSPLLHRKGLSLYLDFCRGISDMEAEPAGSRTYTVCPDFNREVSWQKEADEEVFLGLYQRRETQGRVAECFTEWEINREEDEMETYSLDPWIRVTDGTAVYEIRPGDEKGGDYGFGDARSDRLLVKDINFDGAEDIVLEAGHFGNQGLIYEFGYLWNQKSGKYEFSPSYTMICNPSVDPEHQLVRSSWRDWAASHSWAIYRYADGEFVMQSMLTEEPLYNDKIPAELEVPEGAEVWRWQEVIMKDGEAAEVKNSYAVTVEGEETIYPEAYDRYYEEDSYWGQ